MTIGVEQLQRVLLSHLKSKDPSVAMHPGTVVCLHYYPPRCGTIIWVEQKHAGVLWHSQFHQMIIDVDPTGPPRKLTFK